ncbi:MAG: GAF domain-containing protein [Chloroflexi bacterium]|nr:GAF domain-containing protein [Chloroflexota bacterium]
MKESNLDLPFIIVSGVIGEDIAVAAMKAGAYDYVLKDNLARLGPAVQRALQEAEMRLARSQAEEARQQGEERCRTILENIEDGYYEVDIAGNFTFVNGPLCRLFGYLEDELMGVNYRQYMNDETAKAVYRTFNAVYRTGRPTKAFDWEVIRKDGARRFIETSVSLISDSTGDPIGFRGVVRDVTGRRRAEEALKLNLEQLGALSQASQAVTASLELDQVLAEIVSLANQVVASDYNGVVLVDDAGNIGQSAENLPGAPALEYRIRDEGLTSWIVRSRQAVVVDEIGEDGALDRDLGEGAPRFANPLLVEAGVKSLAGLPLMVKERLLGVLYLYSLRPDAFHGQLFLLIAFANQVAVAIENARLFRAERQQAQRLALLADVSRIAATTLDADVLLQAVAESIHRHFAYPMAELLTLDGEGKTLILRGYSGIPVGSPVVITPGAYRQPIEQGIIGHVVRTGKPYFAADVRTDPYFLSVGATSIRSELCVPILDEGRVIGAVDVESDQLVDFGEEDQSLLEAVADTVAIGLCNARLHQETQRHVQELTLLNRISVGFGMALDLDALINHALEELHHLVNADRTYFITSDPDARTWETTHEQIAPGVEPDIGLSGAFDNVSVELETMLTGQPFAVFDIATDPRVEAAREMYRSLGMQSMLLVPILVGGRLYGALGFGYCRERHAWHPDEIRLLESVAHQLGLGLENVRLFEEARLRADELSAALVRLEELDHYKDRFIQNVSHELRSPLALVRGYAEMLHAGELGELRPEQKKPVAVIARRARMLSDLVKDITLVLEAEVNPPQPEPVPLDELTRTAVEDFQVATEQADLTLRAEIAPHLPPASGSPTYLRRVLDNLLGNAVKFTPAGGTITVQVRQEGKQIVLEVSDTGVGIPANQLDRIFERFYQVDSSTGRRYGGVGLGLALVKDITETYGGHVTVESQVNEGSTFSVYLPIAADTD